MQEHRHNLCLYVNLSLVQCSVLPVINESPEPIGETEQHMRMVLASLWSCSGVIIERFELEGNVKGHQSHSLQ